MKKRLVTLALALCLALSLAVPAFAVDEWDDKGNVLCDLQTERGSVVQPNLKGYDWFQARATATETVRPWSEVANIYAKATIQSPDGTILYVTNQSTEHKTTTTTTLTDRAIRNWDATPVELYAVGIARTRYTNNKIDEERAKPKTTTIGGRNLKSLETEKSLMQNGVNNGMTFGIGKGDNVVAVISDVFGYDLSTYQYISFSELWEDELLAKPIQGIVSDLYMEVQVGERLPLGFLYKNNTAYTVIEQPDSSLQLTKYETQSMSMCQNNAMEVMSEATSAPSYRVVETETGTASQSVVDSLYS